MSPESHGLSGERPKGVKDEAKRANETPARSLAPDPDPGPRLLWLHKELLTEVTSYFTVPSFMVELSFLCC